MRLFNASPSVRAALSAGMITASTGLSEHGIGRSPARSNQVEDDDVAARSSCAALLSVAENHCILYCIDHYIACVLTFRACARLPLDGGWNYIPSQGPSTMTGSPEPHASKQAPEFPQQRVAPALRRRIVAEELTNGCAPDCAFLDRDPADRNWRRAERHVVRVGAALGVRSRAVVADIVGKRSPRIED